MSVGEMVLYALVAVWVPPLVFVAYVMRPLPPKPDETGC